MGHCRIGSPADPELPVHPPMLEQGPSESGRVLEPIRDHHPSVADNSTSHVEEVVRSKKADNLVGKLSIGEFEPQFSQS